MGDDESAIFYRYIEELGGPIADVLVASAVKAVASDTVILIPVIRHGVAEGILGHSAVKSGVKDSHLRQLRHNLHGSSHSSGSRRVVQGGVGLQSLDLVDYLVGQADRMGELIDAVYHSVPHRHDGTLEPSLLQLVK